MEVLHLVLTCTRCDGNVVSYGQVEFCLFKYRIACIRIQEDFLPTLK